MKKLMLFALLFTAFLSGSVIAQGGPGNADPAAMRQRMIERIKPLMKEKTKLTDDQSDKVIDIYFEAQRQRRELRTGTPLSDEEKTKKLASIEEESTKKYKAIPLTDEEIKTVNNFFDEMRKNAPQRREGGNK